MMQTFARVRWMLSIGALSCGLTTPLRAQDPPPPPPAPSATSTVGQAVTNPVTNAATTVSELLRDPAGTPTAGATAFVRTADGYVFLVKSAGQRIYNRDTPPIGFTIVSIDPATNTAHIDGDPAGVNPGATSATAPLATRQLYSQLEANLLGNGTGPVLIDPDITSGATGVREVRTGSRGGDGRDGALFVPPDSGGHGGPGPSFTHVNSTVINTSRVGLEVGSVGGSGGEGGTAYASFWSGRDGGNAGNGGNVTVINNTGVQIATTGTDHHGIFAFSRSGTAGRGGDGVLAPGGGSGGNSANGGNVTVNNHGNVTTNGEGAFGIYALSVSYNGGSGGSQWGLVGQSGSGGYGGNGGALVVTNGSSGAIRTSGNLSHGIFAQSIGGSGGSSGTAGNLFFSTPGTPDDGGNGGPVTVTNDGTIATTGPQSRGIFAQSLGGGGGSSGFAGGLVALGGEGSRGGSASAVAVTNSRFATIATEGFKSDGIFAQSAGGSGGAGSNAGGLVAVGGSGAHAGHGGNVTVTNLGRISTEGASARGIFAQSVGGGGGDGGNSGGMVAVGGSGAGGGNSGTVAVTHGGIITTEGADSTGIVAQSVGGGGGHGGSAGSFGVFAGVAVGGSGSGGGAGGNVNVTLHGQSATDPSIIRTEGDRSLGLFAQSVGGGGGSGGGTVQVSVGVMAAASVSVGGRGGTGGAGGSVTLSRGPGVSAIQTGGVDSPGVMVQSVGGGGGSGGYAVSVAASGGPVSGSVGVALGGDGAGGGAGGAVTVGGLTAGGNVTTGLNASILTEGERSPGFIAQSVGGGGGNGGLSVSAAASASAFADASVGISLGGSAGSGNAGGPVFVALEGDITTTRSQSTGMLVQSVGGGGGNGGGAVAASLSASGGAAGAVSVALGGDGGSGGTGGTVTAITRGGGTISTSGEHSTGILVQSVGRGGGNGGFSVASGLAGGGAGAIGVSVGLGGEGGTGATGGAVTADLQSNVNTSLQNSTGILVQSVGGGGGNGGMNVSATGAVGGAAAAGVTVGLGGHGGTGGTGGRVDVASTGTITTDGDRSAGLVAQSVGGGGGNGGFNISASGTASGIGAGGIDVGLGGDSGSGNHGGDVVAQTFGDVSTGGNQSAGIMAQSVGGGGGSGGFNVSATLSGAGVGNGGVTVGLGGKGGAAGDGRTVSLTVRNDVNTGGDASTGIVAQSIGGGGGTGGFNVSATGAGAGVGSGAIGVGLGGEGGGGGTGGVVTASVTGNVETTGAASSGILVQSVGGGGGSGGLNVTAGAAGGGVGAGGIAVGVGGKGSGGGSASAATLTSIGDVTTGAAEARGVVVQSIGGGGGNGGLNVSATGAGGGVGAGTISVGVGGSGAAGGSAGRVTANVTGDITTDGNNADGFIAQSIGGGGGNGALNVTGSAAGAGVGSGAVSVGVGGGGGAGGNANVVDADYNGTLITSREYSTGFLAQAVGGGGGNGGGTVSAAGSGAGTGSGAVTVGVGGKGGTAGDGGALGVDLAVTADAAGIIETHGSFSAGFVAQSIGGGGGNGGYSISANGSGAGVGSGSVAVGIGGAGARGGDGKGVTANVASTVSTGASDSAGVLVQSVGGGGGNGGFSVTVGASGAGTGSGAVSVGLGGAGDVGGRSGNVTAHATGTITTDGNRSAGFVAQSIGGGGGNGGFNVNVGGSGAGTGSGSVAVGLGGAGAGGGQAGSVNASTSRDVVTRGNMAAGIVAQSVGGGGGNGGFNVNVAGSGAGTGSGAVGVGLGGSAGQGGNAGTVDLRVTNDVNTSGTHSGAVTAQSIGGGGGNGGFNVNVTGSGAGTGSGAVGVGLGGNGGAGGDAERVTSTMTGNISTLENYSTGLLAQSVGGGGGSGGFNVNTAISGAGSSGSGAVSVGIGGSGGTGGIARAVTSTLTGDVETGGNYATGVTAQSIGGGGGTGGFDVSGIISAAKGGTGGVSVGVGGSGGGGGASGIVDNTVTGDVTTTGRSAGGVLAQSVGGGGGAGGFNISGSISGGQSGSGAISVGVGGAGGLGGNSAAVTNRVTGDVVTFDADAFGILAQSVGGGGGSGGFNVSGSISASKSTSGAIAVGVGGAGGSGGRAADVVNTVVGNVETTGARSAGITTQSLGGGGGNGGLNVSGTITGSQTGSGAGLAVGVGGLGGGGGEGLGATSTVTGGVVTMGNSSIGILTQSLGGGGGNGGVNVTASVNLSKENGGTLGVGVGGFGGGGGRAGNVSSTVTTTASSPLITTSGRDSSAVVAQSIGGGGGTGGVNVTGGVNLTGRSGAAIGVGVGGFGGGAGDAGNVVLNTTGDILTDGNNSNGLMAQSIGGGGGSGGTNVTGTLSMISSPAGAGSTTGAASIGVGGFGGGGGNAGAVDVDYIGKISAVPINGIGEGSHGIVAQSIGGGGGNGAVNVSAAVGLSYETKNADGHALVVGVGGFGGVGGAGGAVTVDVRGPSIDAFGNGRSGILASSIGGGGGIGGLNVSGAVVSDSPLIVGVGGMGGNAGTGGDVTVNATTDLFTTAAGTNAFESTGAGLLAQSIGGGGGHGGLNVSGGLALSKEKNVPSITFGIGGFGGAAARSGNVSATHAGVIEVAGGWTHGILAQSLAGGGGHGALNVTGSLNFADSTSSGGKTDLAIVAGLGGHGGAAADAGNASVASSGGTISTLGNHSRGIFAQSVGGGGGTGGMNVTGVFASKSSPIILGVGGFGSGGGNAGSATVTHGSEATVAGKITTSGTGAIGIEASSIGGGGGDAGMNFMLGISNAGSNGSGSGGSGGGAPEHPKNTGVDDSVFANYDKVIAQLKKRQAKDGADAQDQNAESAFAVQLAIGGAGGDAGHGGAAAVHNHSDIETAGSYSHGIMAQSIGGGGGNATLNIGVVVQKESKQNKGLNVAIGGGTGDGGNGSTVTVTHEGEIETLGTGSYGVLAQSIGGGGGNAGLDVAFSKIDGGKIGITIGREGGTGGSAGFVSLASDGIVNTQGDRSYGLLAQSIGNGGGNSSAHSFTLDTAETKTSPARTVAVAVGLEGGHGGFAGNVHLDAKGWVTTEGEDSHAIFAQSVGGGGGNGGTASAIPISNSTAAVLVGGAGGQGGTGGNVDVTSDAQVRTNDHRSVGILAQSIGGGGGTGGGVMALGILPFLNVEKGSTGVISVGGSGGTGMTSGAVTVDNTGVVITDGDDSHGVLAQSIGGGGGTAGMIINLINNKDADNAAQFNLSVGGSGGDGATSGAVTVRNTGGIGTSRVNSAGIFAQSVGGGGGNGNTVLTGNFSTKGSGHKVSIGIGGTGGTGGAAGNVSVFNRKTGVGIPGRIITLADHSPGILAISVGGGGGTGSTTITANASARIGSATPTSVSFSLGGAGGQGGTGGHTLVENDGEIRTFGFKAHGIVAESVGGGGGAGGLSIAADLVLGNKRGQVTANTSTIAVGGFGGDGNRGGDVTVRNNGTIEVKGNKAFGIYAQSVGGGGGDGALAVAAASTFFTDFGSHSSLLIIGMGGRGGTGGDGGNVLVQNVGSITSHGNNSYGIFAQSVGGGGGRIGFSVSHPLWMGLDAGVSAAVGGQASNGKAGTVTVNTTGTIKMHGANSQAQFTQAVSGGGGDFELFLDTSRTALNLGKGGFALPWNGGIVEDATALVTLGAEKVVGAIGSVISSSHDGDLSTSGDRSAGSNTQSVGGGGGNADGTIVVDEGTGIDLELALGAKDVSKSSGGNITLTRKGNVETAGSQSQAVSVQSVGGGGGRAVIDVRTVSAQNVNADGPSESTATVGLGADPSFDNHGGNLDLQLTGHTVTEGDYSPGLVLQSIGAGGGQAYLNGLQSATINLGAADGSTGDGGNIQVANTGAIVTLGELSDGIVLQSIGGGGGYVITDLQPGAVAVNARSHNGGDGGNIEFTQLGDIVAFGDRSRGVVAQSIGGGGGFVDGVFSGTAGGNGAGGSIDLRFEGDVLAMGAGSTAIVAQSVGNGIAGDINISLADGRQVIGGDGGAGIALAGGANNSVLNRGLLTTTPGVGGMAITGTTGNDKVDNLATIVGSVDLGSGINDLFNRAGAWLTSGPTIQLGAGTFTNAGTFDPGARLLQRTTLTGNFAQEGTPTWLVDIGEVGNSDGLFASGRADLGNSLTTVNIFGRTTPTGSGRYRLMEASGGLSAARFKFGTYFGAMPIGQTFSLGGSDRSLDLNLQPSSGRFVWNGAVSNVWSDPFVDGVSNWTREPGKDHIFGTPGAASDVVIEGNPGTILGANFTIGSLSGTGIVSLGGMSLTTGANNSSTTWAGSFVGDGSVMKTGTGAFTLSGVNVHNGPTIVAGGQLLVDGWLGGSSVRVLNGALLGGSGFVPTVTIERGGVLAPGSSIGTLTVNGDAQFEPGSIYRVETTAAGAADFTWLTGSLLGSGATVHVQPGGTQRYRPITFYAIMRAPGAGSATFSSVISDAAYLDPSLQYDPLGVLMTLRRNDVDFRSAGTRGNQSAVAVSLNGLVRTATGEMASVINNVYDLSNAEAVRAMGSMTGVMYQHAASSTLASAQTFMDVNMTRLGHVASRAGASGPSLALDTFAAAAPASYEPQGAWFSGVGGLTRYAGNDVDPSARATSRGFAAGYDAAVGHHLVLGASAANSTPDLELEGLSDRTSSEILHVGVYGRYTRNASRIAVIGGGSGATSNTTRLVTDGIVSSGSRAVYDGGSLFSRVEYGRTFSIGRTVSIEPQLGFQFARVTVDGFTEEGAGALNLVAPERRLSSQRSIAGARTVKRFSRAAVPDTLLEVRAAWAHEFSAIDSLRMRFLGDTAGHPFDLTAPAQLSNSAILGASVSGHAFKNVRFMTSVDSDLSRAIKLWSATLGLRAEW